MRQSRFVWYAAALAGLTLSIVACARTMDGPESIEPTQADIERIHEAMERPPAANREWLRCDPRPAESASGNVDPNGGDVALPGGGARLDVPAQKDQKSSPFVLKQARGSRVLVVAVSLPGRRFDPPVDLTIDPQAATYNCPAADSIAIFRIGLSGSHEQVSAWRKGVGPVTAPLNRLSGYAIASN